MAAEPATGRARAEGGAKPRRRRVRRWLLASVVVLYVISIPWYRSEDAPLVLWGGLPDWVTIALGCYLLTAIANAIAWGLTEIPEAAPSEESEAGP